MRSGKAFRAIAVPDIRASMESTTITVVLLLVIFPNFLNSVFICGFQWGITSRAKWLAKARGMASNGFPTLTAMAAPNITWGVSSMVEVMLSYNSYMLQTLLSSVLGILIFLFIFWKRLKDDYSSQIIFTVSTYIILGILVGSLISSRFFADWYLWAGFVGAILGLIFGMLRFRVKFFESFESVVISCLPWAAFTFLMDSVSESSLSSFLTFLAVLFVIFVFYYLDTHYREFTWYKSGKVGFAGMVTLIVIFVTRFAVSLAGISVISFVDKYEVWVSGGGALVATFLLFNLSRKIE